MTIAKFTFEDGSIVQPTDAGVHAIEQRVRAGHSLDDAVRWIAGGPRWFRDRTPITPTEEEHGNGNRNP